MKLFLVLWVCYAPSNNCTPTVDQRVYRSERECMWDGVLEKNRPRVEGRYIEKYKCLPEDDLPKYAGWNET